MADSSQASEDEEALAARHARHTMPFGAELQPDRSVRFRVWAPEAAYVQLKLEGDAQPLRMAAVEDGWHQLVTSAATAGSRYRYVLPSGMRVPDPASRFQPHDVNGPSEVIDPEAYTWRSLHWKGCPWEQAVLYELHIGTFTREGTFRAAIAKLAHLAALGVTAIEIMSVADFPGTRNWGYDGVLLYAPDSIYGRPEDLKSFVDAAHQHGMMVILDVVYNHFGPEGNYIAHYFPDIVTDRYMTPWGQGLNFDAKHSEKVRKFIVHNALYWVEEFRMDGLRLDAVHAILDSSSTHILEELAQAVRAAAGGRPLHLILESDDRVWHLLGRDDRAQPLSSTAQWNHDMQKLVALALTSSRSEAEDRADTELLGRGLVEGFTSAPHHRNAPSRHPHETRKSSVSAEAFISFVQSHDVIGNRIRGERITDLAPPEVVQAIASVYLLAPQIPMLFMGEEWAASTPFPYFCDYSGTLAEAVRTGRLEQFASPEQRADLNLLAATPDPASAATFLSAKLNWDERTVASHRTWLDWYTRILRTRREIILPLLHRLHRTTGDYEVLGPRQIAVKWQFDGKALRMTGNFSDRPSSLFARDAGETIWLTGTQPGHHHLGPWSIHWSLSAV